MATATMTPTATLHQGDCLAYLRTLELGSVDAVISDPPYGKRFHDGGLGGLASDRWLSPSAPKFKGRKIHGDDAPDVRAVADLARVMREGGALYLFSQWMTEAAWIDATREAGLVVRNRIIWAKPHHGAGDLKTTFGPQHESILFATKGRHELRGSRAGDVWLEPYGPDGCFRKGKAHPNEKPVGLISYLMGKSTSSGMTVLDPYMGSGTTGVAAVRAGLNFIGCEIDPAYFAIAERRIADEHAKGVA